MSDEPESIHAQVARVLATYRTMKERLVTDGAQGEDRDCPPVLHVFHQDGVESIGLLVGGHPTDMAPAGIVEMCRNSGPPMAVIVASEAFGITEGVDTEPPNMPRGELQRRFNEGDPRVTECLNIHGVSAAGDVVASQSYTYGPDGDVVFGEVLQVEPDGGDLLDAIRRGVLQALFVCAPDVVLGAIAKMGSGSN